MRIAVIRQKYVIYGGAENFASEYARALAEAGHEVHVYANSWSAPASSNMHFHPVQALAWNSFLRQWTFARNVSRALERERFDIVQSHERTARQDVYRAGDGCHARWLELRGRFQPGWKNMLDRLSPFHRMVLAAEREIFSGNACRKIVAISDMVRRDILRHYPAPEDKIVVVYNGVRLDRFQPANRELYLEEIRKRHGIPSGSVLFLFVGSGFERKGLEFLLRALAYLPPEGDWRLLVVGKGDWQRYSRFIPAAAREQVVHARPAADIEKYYAAADVFVLPSIYEPFGNANLEALATGLPVVTTRFTGAADIIRHGESGFVVEDPGDARSIAAHLTALLDADTRRRMGRNARALAEQFPPEKNLRAMMQLYEELTRIVPPGNQ